MLDNVAVSEDWAVEVSEPEFEGCTDEELRTNFGRNKIGKLIF